MMTDEELVRQLCLKIWASLDGLDANIAMSALTAVLVKAYTTTTPGYNREQFMDEVGKSYDAMVGVVQRSDLN